MKRHASPQLSLATGLIVDNFAGGGGASLGLEWALGRSPDIAVNHDPEAIALHQANHPGTRHVCGSVWDVDPVAVCAGRPVAVAWFSPDCKHFSKAKGGKPVEQKVRGLAWVVVRWAKLVRPAVIILENVEEFETWGPLLESGLPNPLKRGLTFRRWVGQLRAAGYHVELRQLRAADYGAPTSRKRLFIIARSDGRSIVWPTETHGPSGRERYRTAADCIQWEIPCPSIFERRRPLVEATLRRIGRGLGRFVIDTRTPFIVPGPPAYVPSLVQSGYGERVGQSPRSLDIHEPIGTIVAGGVKHRLVAAFLAKHYGGGYTGPGSSCASPVGTVTTVDHNGLVAAFLRRDFGQSVGAPIDAPVPTITAGGGHLAEVRAFLTQYNGTSTGGRLSDPLATVTTRDRFGLVRVDGRRYRIDDIGSRMLSPRELFRAQGFPDTYRIDVGGLSKSAQVRMCGNSVCPPIAAAIVRANVGREEVAVA